MPITEATPLAGDKAGLEAEAGARERVGIDSSA